MSQAKIFAASNIKYFLLQKFLLVEVKYNLQD